MKVIDIYSKYNIPLSLQEHMLRVAAMAQIICENWQDGEIDEDSIVQACLFHDIAKPMGFDIAKQVQYGMSEVDIKNLQKLQEYLKSKYGGNEHQATVKICAEIGCSPKAVELVNNLEWEYIPKLLESNNIESLIPIYCDMRIGIKGILTLQERLEDLRKRTSEDKDNVADNGHKVENLLKDRIKMDLNAISNNQIEERFHLLSNIEV